MDQQRLQELLRQGESLTVEFKSDRQMVNDATIYEEVVAMANTDGGALLIGVEDDGRVSGVRPRHGQTTDPIKLQAAIFNNTVPNVNPRVYVLPCESTAVLVSENKHAVKHATEQETRAARFSRVFILFLLQ